MKLYTQSEIDKMIEAYQVENPCKRFPYEPQPIEVALSGEIDSGEGFRSFTAAINQVANNAICRIKEESVRAEHKINIRRFV